MCCKNNNEDVGLWYLFVVVCIESLEYHYLHIFLLVTRMQLEMEEHSIKGKKVKLLFLY